MFVVCSSLDPPDMEFMTIFKYWSFFLDLIYQALADAIAAEQEAARLRALADADAAAAAAMRARQEEEDERMRQLLLADQQERVGTSLDRMTIIRSWP